MDPSDAPFTSRASPGVEPEGGTIRKNSSVPTGPQGVPSGAMIEAPPARVDSELAEEPPTFDDPRSAPDRSAPELPGAPPSSSASDPPPGGLVDLRLVPRRVLLPARCRCGTYLRPGELAFVVEGMPELVLPLFEGKMFCQCRCIRAEFLELLETLDAMVGSPGEELVTDLRPTYAQLAGEFASLLHE
jgi:hypothetical protein